VVLPLIELSVVPVASKNTSKGAMPEERTVVTFSAKEPPEPVQEPASALTVELTATVVDCWVLPPAPLQLKV
jgi:hypothetical protein